MTVERVDRWSRALSHRRLITPASWYVLCELLERDAALVVITSRQLADATGLGRDAARRALRSLEAIGLIARAPHRDERGRFGSLCYVVVPPTGGLMRPQPGNSVSASAPSRRTRSKSPIRRHQLDQLSLLSDNTST